MYASLDRVVANLKNLDPPPLKRKEKNNKNNQEFFTKGKSYKNQEI